jgi:Tfp pilus assembly protein PilN
VLIEINLAPGAASAKARRLPGITLPSLPSLGGQLPVAGGALAALLVLSLVAYGYVQMGSRATTLQSRIQQEVTDSTRFASTIALMQSLQARQDTITRKIEVIRAVDQRRFVWPHLLDEISFAVPAFTWVTEIVSTEAADQAGPTLTIQGNAGSTLSLTRFMKNLESSPFVREVALITTEQDLLDGRTIQRFSLEARYRVPDPTVIQTVPILVLD